MKIIPVRKMEIIVPERRMVVRERLKQAKTERKYIEGYYSDHIFHVTQCPRYPGQCCPPDGTIHLKEINVDSTRVSIEINPSVICAFILLSIPVMGVTVGVGLWVANELSALASLGVVFATWVIYKTYCAMQVKFMYVLEERIQQALQPENERVSNTQGVSGENDDRSIANK